MDLPDKVILLTGGQRVGQFVAHELAAAGATMVMTYLKDPSEVAPVVAKISQRSPGRAVSYQLDLADEDSIRSLMENLTKDFPQIDALINMASIFVPDPAELTYLAIAY